MFVASVSFFLIKCGALLSIYLRLVDTAACFCHISSVTWSNASSLSERLWAIHSCTGQYFISPLLNIEVNADCRVDFSWRMFHSMLTYVFFFFKDSRYVKKYNESRMLMERKVILHRNVVGSSL